MKSIRYLLLPVMAALLMGVGNIARADRGDLTVRAHGFYFGYDVGPRHYRRHGHPRHYKRYYRYHPRYHQRYYWHGPRYRHHGYWRWHRWHGPRHGHGLRHHGGRRHGRH